MDVEYRYIASDMSGIYLMNLSNSPRDITDTATILPRSQVTVLKVYFKGHIADAVAKSTYSMLKSIVPKTICRSYGLILYH